MQQQPGAEDTQKDAKDTHAATAPKGEKVSRTVGFSVMMSPTC